MGLVHGERRQFSGHNGEIKQGKPYWVDTSQRLEKQDDPICPCVGLVFFC